MWEDSIIIGWLKFDRPGIVEGSRLTFERNKRPDFFVCVDDDVIDL